MTRKVPEQKNSGPALSGWARNLELETGVVLSPLELSPRDLAAAAESGSIELDDPAGRTIWLRAGDVLVAEGRLVRKRGKTFFQVTRMADAAPLVADGKLRPVLWQPEEWTSLDPEFKGIGKALRQNPQQ